MSDPFLGEIRFMSFGQVPRGWAKCDGQVLAIAQNQALFSLLGTNYGGDGRVTFALPDYRGRVPIHMGQGIGLTDRTVGSKGGEENHTLSLSELPAHTHSVTCNNQAGNTQQPAAGFWATDSANVFQGYAGAPDALMLATAVSPFGQAAPQPHQNVQPYLVLNAVIALIGVFPARD